MFFRDFYLHKDIRMCKNLRGVIVTVESSSMVSLTSPESDSVVSLTPWSQKYFDHFLNIFLYKMFGPVCSFISSCFIHELNFFYV